MSCLFVALAPAVGDTPDALRQRLCSFLALDHVLAFAPASQYIEWESGCSLASYVSRMRQPSTWGGAIEIQAFCELFHLSVVVVNLRDRTKSIVFSPHGYAVRTIFVSWNGGHYEPIKYPTQSMKRLEPG